MAAKQIVLLVLRLLVLLAALGVVGLGAFSKYIIHDVDIRGDAAISEPGNSVEDTRYWREFLAAILDSTLRIWISIAASSFAFLTMTLVILSLMLKSLQMPSSVRVPLEMMSLGGMIAVFGCSLSLVLSIGTFIIGGLEPDSADLKMFALFIPMIQSLVIVSGTGLFLNLVTGITAMIQACLRARAKQSCSFEPTASALGMVGPSVALPTTRKDRVPTMYDPDRPMPQQDDEEVRLVGKEAQIGRVDSGLSIRSEQAEDVEKQWPIVAEKPQQVLQTRPSRPWDDMPPPRNSGVHAL